MLVNLSGEAVGPADNSAGSNHNNNNNGNSNSNGNSRAPFMRGDKSSASVRLRTKKSEIVSGNPGNGKKRNRHSGDFSFFSSKSSSEQQQQQSNAKRGTGEPERGCPSNTVARATKPRWRCHVNARLKSQCPLTARHNQ